MSTPDEVLAFWLDEIGPDGWYKSDPDLDEAIRDRFEATWDRAAEGGLGLWLTYPAGTLAYICVTDQFSRNLWRSDKRAFSLDVPARAAATMAIGRGWDNRIDPPARQFFYLPLMHSENLSDQERGVRLMLTRLSDDSDNLLHAKAHREVIRRFGRFPHRNDDLGRATTQAEAAFLAAGGYGKVVRDLQAAS